MVAKDKRWALKELAVPFGQSAKRAKPVSLLKCLRRCFGRVNRVTQA